MVDSGGEVALGRLEWVVSGEMNVQEEHSAREWRIIGPHNGCLPVILIFLVDGASRAVGRGSFPRSISSFWILLSAISD